MEILNILTLPSIDFKHANINKIQIAMTKKILFFLRDYQTDF